MRGVSAKKKYAFAITYSLIRSSLLFLDFLVKCLAQGRQSVAHTRLTKERDVRLAKFHGQRLQRRILSLPLQQLDLLDPRFKRIRNTRDVLRFVSCDSDDAPDALRDARLFRNDEVLDVAGTRDVRTAAEFDARVAPLGVLDVLCDFVYVVFERHDAHGVWVYFAEHGTEAGDLLCEREREVFAEYFDVLLDPVDAHAFDAL
jgi:hypothetical protein